MSKKLNLTENRYTLNDIFSKNYQVWFMLPLMLYLLVDIPHVLIYSIMYRPQSQWTTEQFLSFLGTKRDYCDYLFALIDFAIILGAVFELIAIISFIVNQKHALVKCPKTDYIPLCFFGVFSILMLVSAIVNGGVDYDLMWGLTVRGEPFFGLFAYFLMYYLCGSFVRKEKYKYLAIYTYLAVSLMLAITTLWDKYVYDLRFIGVTGLCSIFYHFNFYGYFLTIAILLSASLVLMEPKKSRRVFAFLMLCLNSFVLAVNNTMGCFLACIVALLFMIVAASLKKKKFSVGAVALLGVFLAITFLASLKFESFFTQLLGLAGDVKSIATDAENAKDAGTYRWGLWVNQVKLIKKKPWIGYGFEGACAALEELAGQDKVHNEYLNYAGDYGIPAAIIYIAGLISIYIKALKKRAQVDGATFCCLVAALGYIGSAFFGNTVIYVVPFFFIFLGLANSISSPELVAEMERTNESDSDEEASEETDGNQAESAVDALCENCDRGLTEQEEAEEPAEESETEETVAEDAEAAEPEKEETEAEETAPEEE